jgi:hypothetical protein
MTEAVKIDAVLTDDESELVTLINGLEKQAQKLEEKLPNISNASTLMTIGAGVFLGLAFAEKGTPDRLTYLTVTSGLVIGGFERLIKERKIVKSIRSKNLLANQLKAELDPTDLERYEERNELEDDDEYYDF